MLQNLRQLVLIPVCLLLAGCEKLWPTVTAADQQAARQVMPMSEVSLMVRSRYDQNKIIAEVQRRHIPALIDAATEQSLVRFGANPVLIAALKNNANILTKMQKQAFDELAANPTSATTSARVVHERKRVQPTDEQETQLVTSQPASVNTSKIETPEDVYWKAEAAYRAKKRELESKITSEQGLLNWKRAHGYHQSELASSEDILYQHEDELKNLHAPIR
jgi:hypothetical protein